MKDKVLNSSGFTLIELMVTLVIIGVLASLLVNATALYRQRSYYSISEQLLNNARTAMAAGKIDEEQFPNSLIYTIQTAPGPIQSALGKKIAPGLVVPKDSRIYVRHDPRCAASTESWCLEDYIQSRHCKSNTYLYWYRYSNGHQWTARKVAASWNC